MSDNNSRCSSEPAASNRYFNIQHEGLKFSTRAVLVGQEPDPSTGAISVPIYQTSTFLLDELGSNKGYQYARTHNPTRTALEKCLASLENGAHALAFGSGLAAASAVLNLLSQGDHVIVGEDVYGGVYRLFEKVLTRYGLTFTYVDSADIDQVGAAIQGNTKLLWLESPTNPILKLADIRALARLARNYGIISVVDNTFASPYFQRPLDLGADVIVHSTTKYLSGHSDVIGGAVVTSSDELFENLKFHQNAVGAVPGPFDCYLALRGLKTLSLRMREHERSATAVATFLEEHPAVERVYYPGLTSHPQHDLAKSQMGGYGGVVACTLKGGEEAARRLLNGTTIFGLAESLGGTRSLICHPATMTHAPVPAEIRKERGITDGLIRLSIGLEDAEDLIRDLYHSLERRPFAVVSDATAKHGSVSSASLYDANDTEHDATTASNKAVYTEQRIDKEVCEARFTVSV